jgi:hypothetical protein
MSRRYLQHARRHPVPDPTPKPKPRPKPFHPLEGVDGVSVPSGAQLKAAGKHFVGRYISTPGNPKNITRAEAADMHRHGISVLLFFETTGTSFAGGSAAGVHDARLALDQLKTLGAPASVAVYFTIDTDPHGHESEIATTSAELPASSATRAQASTAASARSTLATRRKRAPTSARHTPGRAASGTRPDTSSST